MTTIALQTGRTVTPPQLLDALNSLVIQCNAAIPGASISLFTGNVVTPPTQDDAVNRLILQINSAITAAGGTYTISLFSRAQTADILNVLNSLVIQINAAIATISTGYHADAVVLDGSTWLSIASLACTDNGYFSMSVWLKYAIDLPIVTNIWAVDPVETGDNVMLYYETNEFHVVLGPDSNNVIAVDGVASDGVWINLLYSIFTDAASGSRQARFYVNDVDVTDISLDMGSAFIPVVNGFPFFIFTDSFGGVFTGDVADLWIAPGVSLLAAGDISEASRRLFISAVGKPVDPSGFPSSAVLFSGNASTFSVNQGTGGAFTLTGTLTNASTSPSD